MNATNIDTVKNETTTPPNPVVADVAELTASEPAPQQVKFHADGLRQLNPSKEVSEKVRIGQEAMARQRRRYSDWMAIAEALQVGRTEAMHVVHTNQPTGRRYEKAMAEWLVANGFKEIDKGIRCRLLECLQHRTEIDRWLARLTDSERFRFNHPDTVLKRWKAATTVLLVARNDMVARR